MTPPQTGRALVIVGAPVGRHPSTGGEMRRQHIIAAVRRVMPTDVFVVHATSEQDLAEMEEVFAVRAGGLSSNPARQPRIRRWIAVIRHPGLPSRIARRNSRAIAAEFTHFATSYVVTVVERIEDYLLLRPELTGHVIVDFDDLESDLVGQLRHLNLGDDESAPPKLQLGTLRSTMPTLRRLSRRPRRALTLALDEWRWKWVERWTASMVGHVLVCNDEDCVKLGSPSNAVMARNGFELSGPPVGRLEVRDPPTVGFWGSIGYLPNADGAAFLVKDVLPHLKLMMPNVRVLIVGRGADRLAFDDQSAVTVEGYVTAMAFALERIDVAVVPLRMGAGTRIKILEAWANQIPVVSTSIGAYGLARSKGAGVLVADSASELARSLKEALTDNDLRRRLIAEGLARVQMHSWAGLEASIGQLISGVCDPP